MKLSDRFSKEEVEDYRRLNSNEGRRIFCQEKYKRDFRAFIDLLGYRDLGKFHEEQIKEIEKLRKIDNDIPIRRLWLWSRGFFKTSILTEAHSLWLIINNPNIRILIVSFSLEVAKKPLQAIRNQFIGNSDFRYFFREYCPKQNKDGKIEFGTSEYLTIPNRTKNLKEPTVMCAGVGTNITGLHFDIQKIDDLVNIDGVTNDTQIQASKDYFSLLGPIFDNPTCPRQDVIGTIYHFNDLHSCLLKNEKFISSIIPVHDDNYNFIFPERIPREKFESEILNDPNTNPYDIQRQYLLKPLDPKDSKFKSEWWKEYDVLPHGLSEYILCDPASTQKKKSDYTVIEVWGVDKEENYYLVDGLRDKLRSDDRVRLYIEMAKRCKRLKGAKYEVLGGRHGDLENIQKEFYNKQMYITPKEVKSSTSSKIDRVEQRLVGKFHTGKVYFPHQLIYKSLFDGKIHDFIQEYRLEFLQFPFSEHDDILDCHSQLFDGSYIEKGLDSPKEKEPEDKFMWWRNKAIEQRNMINKKYIFGNKRIHKGIIPSQIGFD